MAPLLVGMVLTSSLAQTRWQPADQMYGAWELHQGGASLERVLFARGWPTDAAHRRLTLELAGEPAVDLTGLGLAPGVGLPITASSYEADRLNALGSRSRVRDTQGLLRQTLSDYKTQSGYAGSLPRSYVPSFLAFAEAGGSLQSSFRRDDVATYRRPAPPKSTVSLEGVGFTLLAQARFAREELMITREEEGKRLVGRDGRTGFLALVALHSALATVRELQQVVVDTKLRALQAQTDLLTLDEFRHHLPASWEASVADEVVEHSLTGGTAAFASYLRGQAATLLALAELAQVTDPKGVEELHAIRRLHDKDVHIMVVEAALFVFRALRSLHVDVRLRRAISKEKGSSIETIDLGVYLMAMQAFKQHVELDTRGSTQTLLGEERGKCVTLISTLSDSIRIWQQQREDGFYNVYSVRTNSADVQAGESLASNAFAIRGLLASHKALSEGAAQSAHLEAAKVAVAALDRRRWSPTLRAYTENDRAPKASGFGAVAVLGALRELALITSDGRYLGRYRQYLQSLSDNGFYPECSGTESPRLATTVTFQAGSK
jgi:hypothetical protein